MDRKYLGGICLLTAAVTMASCSSDEPISNDDNVVGESKQTISLAVANTGDNFISTRAGRPLYSSEAKQDINKVKVVIYYLGAVPSEANMDNIYEKLSSFESIYGEKKIVAEKTFSPWMNSGVSFSYNNTYGHGRQASWTLSTADQIKKEGVYMAYAVGYNDDEYTDLTTNSDFGALTKSIGDTEVKFTFPLSVKQNTGDDANKGKIFEVFAGSAPFIVTEKGNTDDPKTYEFDVALTLHRQVAGTIGYFTNIPVKGNSDYPEKTGAKLRLVASNKCDNAVFAAFNYGFTGKTDESADNIKYVVNGWDNNTKTATKDAMFYGSSESDAYTVYEVALKDWFTGSTDAGMDSNSDGILNEHDTWTNALSSTGAAVKTGCVLGGSFLFPFPLVADKATFQLQMLDSDNNIIRFWNIRLQTSTSSSDSQIEKKATLVKSNGKTEENSNLENSVNYSVLRNHLYNIGQKSKDDSSDSDTPQDLNKETLILRVNDNWEMVHQMDIF